MIGDNMKKTLTFGLLFLIIGFIIGNYLYGDIKENLQATFGEGEIYYFLQEGVYSKKEIMEENIKNMDIKAVDFKNNKYYVYMGITKDQTIASKIKKIYEEEGYQIYIKEITISSDEFSNNVDQFDLLIKNTEQKDEILTIEEVVLANYEEIIKKN